MWSSVVVAASRLDILCSEMRFCSPQLAFLSAWTGLTSLFKRAFPSTGRPSTAHWRVFFSNSKDRHDWKSQRFLKYSNKNIWHINHATVTEITFWCLTWTLPEALELYPHGFTRATSLDDWIIEWMSSCTVTPLAHKTYKHNKHTTGDYFVPNNSDIDKSHRMKFGHGCSTAHNRID